MKNCVLNVESAEVTTEQTMVESMLDFDSSRAICPQATGAVERHRLHATEIAGGLGRHQAAHSPLHRVED